MEVSLETLKKIVFGSVENDGMDFYRIPVEYIRHIRNTSEEYGIRALSTAGIFLDFYTDSSYFSFSYDGLKQASSREWCYFSLYINEKEYAEIGEEKSRKDAGCYYTELPKGFNRVTLFFPNLFRGRLNKIELSENANIESVKKKRKILFIGDSITQGYDAKYAGNSYVNRFALKTDSEVINVGIGGARFDEFWIEKKFINNPDLIIVALGTNAWKWETKDYFKRTSEKFFKELCSLYLNTPIFVLLPIWREEKYSDIFQGTLIDARKILTRMLQEYSQIQMVDLWNIIPHDNSYYSDGLHPTDQGMECFANGLVNELKTRMVL